MRSVTPELADALTQPERVIGIDLRVDWDGDGYNGDGSVDDLSNAAARVTIDQTLTTQVPSATQPVVGAAVAQLTVDLEQGHVFGSRRLPVVRNITTATAATGTGTISIARPTVQPGDLVLLWIAAPGSAQFAIRPGGSNAQWTELMFRGDFNGTRSRVTTGHLLVRRVPADTTGFAAEPTTYTFKISELRAWTAVAVSVAGGYIPGVHKYSTKGSDAGHLDDTYTQLDGVPIKTTLDQSLVLGFFAGWAGPGGGVTWTPVSPATELADVCSTSGIDNAAVTVTQVTGATPGTYQLSATISVATEPGVVATIALAPLPDGDDTQNAAWVYSELNPNSLLAGKQRDARITTAALEVATRAGMQSVPLFTGRSLGVDVSARARRATFTALDNREFMRTAAVDDDLPPAVIAESPEVHSGETLPYFPGLEATWIVSYCFAWCRFDNSIGISYGEGPRAGVGFFASPNVRPATMLHLPCHGSLTPFIGFTLYAYSASQAGQTSRVLFDRGPYVASTYPAPATPGKIDGKFSCILNSSCWTSGGGHAGRIEYQVKLNTAGASTVTLGVAENDATATQYAYLNVTAAGVLTLLLGATSGGVTRTVVGPTLPSDGAWHWVGCHWDSRTGSATFRVDSTNTVVGFTTFTNGTITDISSNAFLTLTDGAQVAEVQVAGGFAWSPGFGDGDIVVATDPFAWENFTPTAFIDRSENVMDGMPPVDAGSDVWQLVTQLAEAEFAAVYFDADGYPHYRTRYSDVTDAGIATQRTLSVLNALRDVDYASGLDQLANQIRTSWTPIATTLDGVAWRPSSPLRVPANSTVTVRATLNGVVLPTAASNFTFTNANTKPDGSGTAGIGNITMGGSVSGSSILVQFTNNNNFDVYIVDPTGQPATQIVTSWMSAGTVTYGTTWQDDDSVRRHGPQPLSSGLPATRWRQREASSDNIALILLSDLAEPRPVLQNIKVVGDPRLQIGDVVRFVDPDGLGLDDTFRLVGISPQYTPNDGFTQALVARSTGCGIAVWDQSFWDDCTVWGA